MSRLYGNPHHNQTLEGAKFLPRPENRLPEKKFHLRVQKTWQKPQKKHRPFSAGAQTTYQGQSKILAAVGLVGVAQ